MVALSLAGVLFIFGSLTFDGFLGWPGSLTLTDVLEVHGSLIVDGFLRFHGPLLFMV